MNKLLPAIVDRDSIARTAEALRKQFPETTVQQMIAESLGDRIFQNDTYQVIVRSFVSEAFEGLPMVHLSIRRLDREAIHDWRDLQEIKNQLVGPECEAIELYPAESRLVDTSNQYHLWCWTNPEVRVPIGWDDRLVSGESELLDNLDIPNTKQRPRQP